MYNQNNFKPLSKTRTSFYIACSILAVIMSGAFAMGVLSATLEMMGL